MDNAPASANLEVADTSILRGLSGPNGALLGEVARSSGAQVNLRGNTIFLSGEQPDVSVARRFLVEAVELTRQGVPIGLHDIPAALRSLRADPNASLLTLLDEAVIVTQKRRPIVPKGVMQRRYLQLIRTHDLTFGVGPAGTGKTYLAMAMAASALVKREVKRIVLTRPAVEAGERLGFLPGDLVDKVDPYLRPLYDALHDMLDFEKVEQLRERGQIEVAPLAFMRGRTLNDAFVILDEAQNATSEQMRMLLTRLGFGSKAVVTGDVTQTDLPRGARSGLREALELLDSVEGISICQFTDADVVRHPLVQKIVVAYEKNDAARKQARERARAEATDPAGRASSGNDRGSASSDHPSSSSK